MKMSFEKINSFTNYYSYWNYYSLIFGKNAGIVYQKP